MARLIRPPTHTVCVTGDSSRAGVVEDREDDARCRAEDLGEAVLRVLPSSVPSERLQSGTTDLGNVPDTEETGRTVSPATIAKTSDSTCYNVPNGAFVQVPTRRTRQRKGTNLIDDLFSGLD